MKLRTRLAKLYSDWLFKFTPLALGLREKGTIVSHVPKGCISDAFDVKTVPMRKNETYELVAHLDYYFVTRKTPYGETIWRIKHDKESRAFYHVTYNRVMKDWLIESIGYDDVVLELKSLTNPYVSADADLLGAASRVY